MSCVGPLICFFSPSPATESPLSLRRLRFIEQSMASFSFFSLLFFFPVDDDNDDFVDDDDDDDDDVLAVFVVVVTVESVLVVVVIVGLFEIVFVAAGCFMGVFFIFSPLNYLGPALFFVGAVPSFRFGGFIWFGYGRCCCCCCCCCCSRRICCYCFCCGLLRAGF